MEQNYPIETICPYCNKKTIIYVNETDYNNKINNKRSLKGFYYLTLEEQNQLASGICPTCFKEHCFETEEV